MSSGTKRKTKATPKKTPDKVYEELVWEIYQALVDQSDVKNVTVQHDVTLTGKSGATHQIDVYWEFEVAGLVHRTCIECKHYGRKVEKTKVAAFSRVISDLEAKGIMVTTEGYQKGALLVAKADGIRLVQVNWIIRKITANITVKSATLVDLDPVFDPEAVRAMQEKHPGESLSAEVLVGREDKLFLLNADGTQAVSFHDLKTRILDRGTKAGPHIEPLSGLYLMTNKGPLLVKEVRCRVARWSHQHEALIASGEGIAKAMVKEIFEGGVEKFFHEDGTFTLEAEKNF